MADKKLSEQTTKASYAADSRLPVCVDPDGTPSDAYMEMQDLKDHASGVTDGDSHDHTGGSGAQIDHSNLANKGTNTHTQIDNHIADTDIHQEKYTDSEAVSAVNADVDHGSTASHDYFSGDHVDLSNKGTNTHTQIDSHLADTSNPHGVTAAQVNAVAKTGNETIAGVKTFSSFPVTPSTAPSSDYQAANKKYVDDNAGGGSSLSVNYETLSADKTISEGDPTIQVLDPGGSNRVVTLPDELTADGEFLIVNNDERSHDEYLTITCAGDTSVSAHFTKLYTGASVRVVYNQSADIWTAIGPGWKIIRTAVDSYGASDENVSIGVNADGSSYGTAVGYYSDGSSGAAVGRYSDGSNGGAAVGQYSDGSNAGAAVGEGACCNSLLFGSAIAFNSEQERIGGHAISGDHMPTCMFSREEVMWLGTTTNGSATELFLHGDSPYRCTLLADSVVGFEIRVVAKSTAGDIYDEKIEGTIKRDGADNTVLVGSNDTTVINDESGGSWSVSVTADDTNECIKLSVSGAAATTINWGARGILIDRRI